MSENTDSKSPDEKKKDDRLNKVSTADLERGFLARVFYRRGGKTIQENFIDVKKTGANLEWFDDPRCKLLWMAAEELFGEPDFASVSLFKIMKRATGISARTKDRDLQNLKVDKDFFDDAEHSISGADDMAGLTRMLKDAALTRLYKQAMQEASDDMGAGDGALSTGAKLISRLQNIIGKETTNGKVSVSDMVDNVIAQYDNVHHHVQELGESDYTPGLPLPWKKLSFAMNGFNTTLTVLAARPGVGKTSLAVEMMRFWMDNGIKVVLNSLDMSAPELIKRQLAEQSQVSSRKMQFGKSAGEDWKYDREKVVAAGERLKQLERDGIYTLYGEPDIDVLKANVKILKDQGLVDVLVVDYIQLMNYRNSSRHSQQQVVTYVTLQLQQIANELQIPVLALSQINRDSSKDGTAPQLHNIKDSGMIEQAAANVIILHPNWDLKKKWNVEATAPTQFMRDGQFSASVKSLMPMWVILAKARDGDANTEIPFLVVQNKSSWYQADWEASSKDEMWNRVWDNWKHDSIEKVWAQNGSLIRVSDRSAIDRFNAERAAANASVREEDLPEPPEHTEQPSFDASPDDDIPF